MQSQESFPRGPQPGQSRVEHLDSPNAAHTLHELNAQRSHMSGINRAPIPVGAVSLRENGMRAVAAPDGRRYEVRSDGSVATFRHGGTVATFRPDGTPRLIQVQGMTIAHGQHQEGHFEAQLAGRERVVGWGSHGGYVERPLPRGDGHYVQRTYILGGRQTTAVYRTFDYHGITLAHYVPDRRYSREFYDWAARPWPAHLHYRWGFRDQAWAAPYRHHFNREYRDFAAWLADYLLVTTLWQGQAEAAGVSYADLGGTFYVAENSDPYTGQDAANSNSGQAAVYADPVELPPTEPIEEQIRADQKALAEKAAAPSSTQEADLKPVFLDPAVKVYFVNSQVFTHDAQGDCTLANGAVLFLPVPAQPGADTVDVVVKHSLQGQCAIGSTVPVGVRALQEMNNWFVPNVNKGTQTVLANIENGSVLKGPVGSSFIAQEGQPSATLTTDAVGEIVNQEERAKSVEQTVTGEAASGSNPK